MDRYWWPGDKKSPPGWYNANTQAAEIRELEKTQKKKPGGVSLSAHMEKLDKAWRDMEGRKPFHLLSERERILEGIIPWDPVRLKELENEPG